MLSRFNHVLLFATLWTLAVQVPLSMGFPRQEYWSGLPFPPPVDLPDPGVKPMSLASSALAGGFFTTSATWEDHNVLEILVNINRQEKEIRGINVGREKVNFFTAFLFWLCHIFFFFSQDLSSATRDRIHATCIDSMQS